MKKYDIEKLKLPKDKTIKEAMRQMDVVGLRILFVTDHAARLLGTITDGDFRKWHLAGRSIHKNVSHVYNAKPVKFYQGYNIEEIKQVMVAKRIECVPIVDRDNKIIDALFWEDIFGDRYMHGVKKLSVPVAIMAGGEGTRLSPFTKILPKPLVPVNDKPIIEVIMDNFGVFGCSTFYLLLGYKGVMVKSYFDNTRVPYKTIYKFEKHPGGTAGALRYLPRKNLGHSLFVSNCDIIIKADYSDIYNFHISSDCDITIVGAMRHFVIPYGILKMKAGGGIEDLVEKPEYNFFVNTGMYVVKSSVLSEIPKKGIFNFTDLIDNVRKNGGKIAVYPISEKSWFDIGQLELWQEASSYFSADFSKDKTL